ncbi:hypothetical protein [Nesterenkonia pannonica]|uniref:hypothetical protein n=1 Tax=Nesterenkonia pannonica TaxID=1548602 RepID=UPI0021647DF7|nr:hypothetical protein [Nesterenkonia pannonica]
MVQLDTDEVMLSLETFFACLERAEEAGASALDYPSRWLYSRTAGGQYLEASTRFGKPRADYPGPWQSGQAPSSCRLGRRPCPSTASIFVRGTPTRPTTTLPRSTRSSRPTRPCCTSRG